MPKKYVPDYIKQRLIGDSRHWFKERTRNDYATPIQPEGHCPRCGSALENPLTEAYCPDCTEPGWPGWGQGDGDHQPAPGLFDDPDTLAEADYEEDA